MREMGGLCLKLILASLVGFPDRTVLLPRGRVAFVELKSPTGTTSHPQDIWLGRLQKLGFVAVVLSSKQEIDDFLRGFKNVES